ncbi:MAG: hypothetical protein ACREDK_06195 [Thermoplasmata archaeon]
MDTPSPSGSILVRLLEAAGYRVEGRPGLVRAVRGKDHRAVLLVEISRSPAELESEFPSDSVHRTIVFPENPGDVARGLASERGIEVIDPSTLGPALGELLLPGPDGTAGSDALLDSGEVRAPPTVVPGGDPAVHPRITREDAEALAGVDGSRVTLRLVPFYVAPYRVRAMAPHGSRGPVADHLVAVNALSGRVEVWEPADRDLVDGIDEPHRRLEPRRSSAECRALAEEELVRRHTVSVDHTEQHGGALVIERRKVPPGAGDLKIGPSALVHVPFWYIESRQGRIVLDAVTGSRSVVDERDPVTLR